MKITNELEQPYPSGFVVSVDVELECGETVELIADTRGMRAGERSGGAPYVWLEGPDCFLDVSSPAKVASLKALIDKAAEVAHKAMRLTLAAQQEEATR